ncbi:hypothetical protein EHI48_34995 [Rhizobium sp. WSM1325]|nr:hypothetical protein EHI48_34995 [Rhizobium leguminosarum]
MPNAASRLRKPVRHVPSPRARGSEGRGETRGSDAGRWRQPDEGQAAIYVRDCRMTWDPLLASKTPRV